jgi:hypothetical protein
MAQADADYIGTSFARNQIACCWLKWQAILFGETQEET